MQDKFLIVGSGGREGAFATSLAKDTELYAVVGHKNPTIIQSVEASGGQYHVGSPDNPQEVARFATEHAIDYAFVNADGPLAAGVVDVLLENNIKTVGGTKEATRIEWDKIYSIDLVKTTCPEATPFYTVVSQEDELQSSINAFVEKGLSVVVKPEGLTGGKGVKVMPEHLASYQDAMNYAAELLRDRPNEKVLLVEKLEGIEFTVMGFTDGKNLVLSPASYDYPFRLSGDRGAGTGGMGCFTDCTKKLPFMTDKDMDDCRHIMQRTIDHLRDKGCLFQGVLNGGFFLTKNGIRFMEFNSRFGDPEGLNILSVLHSPFSNLIKDIWQQKLSEESVAFLPKASVIKYLVAKEYPDASPAAQEFTLDTAAIEALGLSIFFSSAEQLNTNHYQTLRTSRVVAIGSVSDNIVNASQQVDKAIEQHITSNLEYRKDIGSQENLNKLSAIAQVRASR